MVHILEIQHYPDCRPNFAKKLESAFNQGEIDGIKSKLRKNIEIWSPYRMGLSKSDLLKSGMKVLGNSIFKNMELLFKQKISLWCL